MFSFIQPDSLGIINSNYVLHEGILMKLHMIVPCDSRMCHDLELIPYVKGQGHEKENTLNHVRPVTLYCMKGF